MRMRGMDEQPAPSKAASLCALSLYRYSELIVETAHIDGYEHKGSLGRAQSGGTGIQRIAHVRGDALVHLADYGQSRWRRPINFGKTGLNICLHEFEIVLIV